MEAEKFRILWENLHQIEKHLQDKSKEVERLTVLTQQLEEKLRAKESDLNQLKMLFSSSQQAFEEKKDQFESQVGTLINRIDTLTGDK